MQFLSLTLILITWLETGLPVWRQYLENLILHSKNRISRGPYFVKYFYCFCVLPLCGFCYNGK